MDQESLRNYTEAIQNACKKDSLDPLASALNLLEERINEKEANLKARLEETKLAKYVRIVNSSSLELFNKLWESAPSDNLSIITNTSPEDPFRILTLPDNSQYRLVHVVSMDCLDGNAFREDCYYLEVLPLIYDDEESGLSDADKETVEGFYGQLNCVAETYSDSMYDMQGQPVTYRAAARAEETLETITAIVNQIFPAPIK